MGHLVVTTKWDNCYYNVGRVLLLHSGTILLQSEKGITKWDNFIRKLDGYYKNGQLLQSGP